MPDLTSFGVLFLATLVVLGGAWLWLALRPPMPPKALVLPPAFTLADITLVSPGSERLEHHRVTVRNGMIERIEPGEGAASTAALSRYAGCYVLPGLVDMHTHLPPATPLNLTAFFCLLHLAHGVTSIRETGDGDGTGVPAAREGIASGAFPGPRVFACGPFVGGDGPPRFKNTIRLKAPGEAVAAVARIRAAGFDCVKAYDDLTLGQIRELKEAAKEAGLRVIGHVPSALAYEEALLPEPQHFFGVPEPRSLARDHILNRNSDWQDVDDARLERIVDTTLAHGIVNTPTLVVGKYLLYYADYAEALRNPLVRLMPRMFREVLWHPVEGIPVYRNLSAADLAKIRDANAKKIDLVRRLRLRGARVLIGTDLQPFTVPGASLHDEMQLFRELASHSRRCGTSPPAKREKPFADLGSARSEREHQRTCSSCGKTPPGIRPHSPHWRALWPVASSTPRVHSTRPWRDGSTTSTGSWSIGFLSWSPAGR